MVSVAARDGLGYRILIPPYGGSNPPAPASLYKLNYINWLDSEKRPKVPHVVPQMVPRCSHQNAPMPTYRPLKLS
jgi:hypothetical protein